MGRGPESQERRKKKEESSRVNKEKSELLRRFDALDYTGGHTARFTIGWHFGNGRATAFTLGLGRMASFYLYHGKFNGRLAIQHHFINGTNNTTTCNILW